MRLEIRVNPRPDGRGGGVLRTAIRFFEDSEKTAAPSSAVLYMPYQTSFLHILFFFLRVILDQVTRSRQMILHAS